VTPKQARFVEEYLQDLNGTQAAIRAGYSEKTANEQAAQLLKKPEVAKAIEAAKDKRSERADVDALWVLKRLHEEATADIADLYDDSGNLLPVKEWPEVWRQGLVQGVEVEELFEGHGKDRQRVGTVRKVRLDPRVRRIELIGKHVGVKAFEDTVNVKGVEGLADRLERIARANRGCDEAARIAPSTKPAPAPTFKREAQPATEERPREPTLHAPVAAKSAPYVSPIPWPDRQASAAAEYDPLNS
jgi:phage terminase small subunit